MSLATGVRLFYLRRCAFTSRIAALSKQAQVLSQKTHVTHVIFDFDGLLVDTESCYAIANQRLLQKFGREFTPEYNAMILGRKEDEAFPMLIKAVGIEDKITPKEYIAQFDAIVEGMLPKCKAMPGAEKLVRHLSKKGVPTAICTGSRGETFERKQKPHEDWLCLITLKVFCPNEPEIKRGKPYPDPYLTTMNRFAAKPSDPSKVLVFEDAPNGGRAAKAAGMQCVMVPDKEWRQEAMKIGVTQVLHSLEEFHPEEFGLPPFD